MSDIDSKAGTEREDSHSLLMGYLLWIFGFLGAHRFYFGRGMHIAAYHFGLALDEV